MSTDIGARPRRGRPLDPAVEVALRAAAFSVLAEHGWRGTTVERIAEVAGVARTTVYRRYGSLHGIMQSLLDEVWVFGPIADTGSLRGDLILAARAAQALWCAPGRADYLSALTAARRENDELAAAVRARDQQRYAALRPIVERAESRGELQRGIDPDLLLDLVCSVVVQRALRSGEPPSADLAERVVDAVLIGYAS